MDSFQLYQNGDCTEHVSGELLLSPEPPDICGVFGEPEVLPRVGEEYQAKIPLLMEESYYLELTKNPTDTELIAGLAHDFRIGLPIPIMWINEESVNIKHEPLEFLGELNDVFDKNGSVEFVNITRAHYHLQGEESEVKVEPSYVAIDSGISLGESENLSLKQEMSNELHHKSEGKGYSLVPGLLGESWSEIEEASFLLGLYIFGKNLVQVKRFIESKSMGDILSFYYGKFYRSKSYCRWSECRKMRSRKCIYGQKIFTGLRQQELLSRLLPRLSEDCKNTLVEISRTFGEGKILLEEYVSTLKAMVGMKSLVEAVGIGKGKHDLTGVSAEPLKPNQVVPLRPEIPIGKACSSLTTSEIIKFLTGDFRLSKARSSDLFWEAVWPRLLARGWHSEQPRDRGYAVGSKHSLVFLMPDVKKFSRRKLVKGDHYFDSVSDVLSKVASDPGLLEFDIEADKSNRIKDENRSINETKLDQDDLSVQQRHCYLRPRTPNHNVDVVKITIVDTSLGEGEKIEVREVRCLPVETLNSSTSRSRSEEIVRDSCHELADDSDSANTSCFEQEMKTRSKPTKIMFDKGVYIDRKDYGSTSNWRFPINGPDSTHVCAKIPKDQNVSTCNVKKPRNSKKCALSQRTKEENSDYITPVTKRRRKLNVCNHKETSDSMFLAGSRLKKEEAHGCLLTHLCENLHSEVDPSQEKLSSACSSPKNSPIESSEGILSSSTCLSADNPSVKPQHRALFDLNLPYRPDADTDEPLIEKQDDQTFNQPDDLNTPKTFTTTEQPQQPPNTSSRRQSTRNRPPTTRALEALACGFLSIKSRKKRGNAFSQDDDLISRPSRRARGRVRVSDDFDTGFVESDVKEEENGTVFSQFRVQSEGDGAQVSGS